MQNKLKIFQFVNNESLVVENEFWEEHPLYKGYYGSNLGRIKYYDNRLKSNNIKIKKQQLNYDDRLQFNITYQKKNRKPYVARFIMECFYGINKKMQVDHIDSVKYNNKLSNLRYVTIQENNSNPNSIIKRKIRNKYKGHAKIKQIDINSNETIKIWESCTDIINELKLLERARSSISAVCNGKEKTAYGYKWEYTEEPDLENEIWKPHPYLKIMCSNKGRLRWNKTEKSIYTTYGSNHKNRFLKKLINKKTYAVHRLIAETWINNPENKPYIKHIDGNNFNNDVKNLVWYDYEDKINR
jgi:hypothetical protein